MDQGPWGTEGHPVPILEREMQGGPLVVPGPHQAERPPLARGGGTPPSTPGQRAKYRGRPGGTTWQSEWQLGSPKKEAPASKPLPAVAPGRPRLPRAQEQRSADAPPGPTPGVVFSGTSPRSHRWPPVEGHLRSIQHCWGGAGRQRPTVTSNLSLTCCPEVWWGPLAPLAIGQACQALKAGERRAAPQTQECVAGWLPLGLSPKSGTAGPWASCLPVCAGVSAGGLSSSLGWRLVQNPFQAF